MCFPERMEHTTVLDIGAYDGFFSFECERRGATVTAVDIISPEESGFAVAHELLRSRVKHVRRSIHNLDPEELGQFDIVLCLGVLYHLRHPLLGLDRVHSVCKDLLILESQICDAWFVQKGGRAVTLDSISSVLTRIPIAQFYPGDELNSDPSNWWSPHQTGLQTMLGSSGFEPSVVYSDGVRAVFHCRRVERSPRVQADVEDVQERLLTLQEKNRSLEETALVRQLRATQEELRLAEAKLQAIERSFR